MITGISGSNYSSSNQAEAKSVAKESAQKQKISEPIAPNHTTRASNHQSQGVKKTIGEEQWTKIVGNAMKDLQGPNTSLNISVHESSKQLLIKVVNQDTGEIIREIPPEKTLDYVANLMEIAGIIVDKKV